MTVERKIPVMFEQVENYDDRFVSVKIWLMHLGQNFNGSYFSKDVVQAAIPSLANTPILGYISDNKDGETDFSEHKMILKKNDEGKYELQYIGQAYGMIPETNNAQFEMKVCDDGVEREFLTVEGLLWNKWDIPTEIMLRDLVKNQSMELDEKYEGYFDKSDKLFHFTNVKFFGACILGDDVKPAMAGSDIEVNFTMPTNDWQKEIQDNMEIFKTLYSNRYQSSTTDNDINLEDKDGEKMKEELLTILTKYSLTEESAIEKGINLADFDSLEHFEAKVKEVVEAPEEPITNFSLTGEQFVSELREELGKSSSTDQYGYVYQDLWYVDYLPDQNIVIAYDCDDGELVGLSYTISGDDIVIDFESEQEYKVQYVASTDPEDETETDFSLVSKAFSDSQLDRAVIKAKEDATTEVASKYSQFEEVKSLLENELSELRQFKASKQVEEKEARISELFAQFSDQLTEEELVTAREQFSQSDVEDIEKELYAIVGKKAAKFSKKEVKPAIPTSAKIPVFSKQEESSEGYAYIIEKALKKSQ